MAGKNPEVPVEIYHAIRRGLGHVGVSCLQDEDELILKHDGMIYWVQVIPSVTVEDFDAKVKELREKQEIGYPDPEICAIKGNIVCPHSNDGIDCDQCDVHIAVYKYHHTVAPGDAEEDECDCEECRNAKNQQGSSK